jgi:hypothetical protein
MELLNVGSSSDAPRFLRAVGVIEVVASDDRSWPLLARFGGQRVYAVPAGEVAHEPPSGRSVPTLWSSAGALVDFGRPVRLSALIFELSDDPWLATPEVGVSDDGSTWRAVGGRASLADATLSLYRDPRHGIGAVVMPPTSARYVRVGPGLPARRTSLAIVEPP